MHRILIVDDEGFERDGVKFLITKYGLELEVAEAACGEEALEYVKEHPIDILLTDIRMREMDGLELAEQVRILQPAVKVIFLSAFGEFEYAQKAIDLQAIQYILKPVDVANFLEVLAKVIQICMEEEKEQEQQSQIQEIYHKSIQWEKHRILADLLSSDTEDMMESDPQHSLLQWNHVLPNANISGERYYRMMMLDTKGRFFDSTDPQFEKNLIERIPCPNSVINLNEYQSLVLLEIHEEEPPELFAQFGKNTVHWFKTLFKQEISIIFSDRFKDIESMRSEYRKIETILESKFFFEEETVRFTNTLVEENNSSQYIDQAIEEITRFLERKEFGVVRARFEELFDHLKNSNLFSVIYVKYICSEIVRSILKSTKSNDLNFFKTSLETIYKAAILKDLREIMIHIFEEYGAQIKPVSSAQPSESIHTVIDKVIQIIEREYQTDLSVETIAERVFLTPSYLSHLFAKQTGTSMIKYLTMHRLAKAKQQLQDTNRKIIDISMDVGYANFPYFCTLFKNYYGKTPTQIREEARL